jgi:hypothetical protein
MVMQNWSRKYMMILLKAGLRVPLLKGYVDDGRPGVDWIIQWNMALILIDWILTL